MDTCGCHRGSRFMGDTGDADSVPLAAVRGVSGQKCNRRLGFRAAGKEIGLAKQTANMAVSGYVVRWIGADSLAGASGWYG